ncbi:hypothetical protein GR158_12190 [Shinella sp. AETb1-6]|uniref:hypothetical protein n=1 Tax=Shinella sp. AETb1-6 TaxID=2692210 RepID=UPI0013717B4A|nr:hypothetical protein [Shinella sp. AETb1-6]MXN51882.1 hypothetical protein [Shinella sp. AETb1-6]
MSWLIYGIIGFTILCGATAVAYALADRDDGRGEFSGATEGDQIHFNQRGSSPSGG